VLGAPGLPRVRRDRSRRAPPVVSLGAVGGLGRRLAVRGLRSSQLLVRHACGGAASSSWPVKAGSHVEKLSPMKAAHILIACTASSPEGMWRRASPNFPSFSADPRTPCGLWDLARSPRALGASCSAFTARRMSEGAWGRGSGLSEPESAASARPASAQMAGWGGRPSRCESWLWCW